MSQVRQAAAQVRGGALAEAHRRARGFVLAATVRLAGHLDLAEESVQAEVAWGQGPAGCTSN